ncbi:MAG TPA: hypothetical protein VE666_09955 [Mycobacterium sp.]|nr:hypothetical protein [Mycobacterium sp.]
MIAATSPRVAETNPRAVTLFEADPSIVAVSPGTSTATLVADDRSPMSSTTAGAAGVEGQDLTVDPASAQGRVVDRAQQAAADRDTTCRIRIAATLVDDRLSDVHQVGCDPQVPRHAVGIANLAGKLGEEAVPRLGCHRGDLVCDPLLGHRGPGRHDVGGLDRPRAGRNRLGRMRRRRRRERIGVSSAASATAAPSRSSASTICRDSSVARTARRLSATPRSPPDTAINSGGAAAATATEPSSETVNPPARAVETRASTSARADRRRPARRRMR